MSLPSVSIVITAYQPKARPYLDLCISSCLNLNYPPEKLEIIIVAPKSYAPYYDGVRTISPPEDTYGMPRGLNFGINASLNELVFVLNDDVVLTRDCLARLVRAGLPEIGLLMPIGNDQQGRYWAREIPSGPYKLEQGAKPDMNAESPYPPCLMFADTLCLYAFLIRRTVFDKVGPFDEGLIGQDDIDMSLRMRAAGYLNAIALDSLVWHAGGASNVLTDAQRQESMRIFQEKWSAK